MQNYIVNKNAQESGEHEVHSLDVSCPYLPDYSNMKALGKHLNCHSAISEAKNYYNSVDGCYYCCRACHTR